MINAGIAVQLFGPEVDELFRQLREHDEARAAREPSRPSFGRCEVCETPLMQPGGFGGTGMCGPCTTGEADTVLE